MSENVWTFEGQDTITAALARAVVACPNRTFVNFFDEKYTYREFDRITNSVAHGLLNLNVQAGERVASLLDNHGEVLFTWYGANKIAAISVAINTAYKGEFLRHQLADCNARVLVMESDYVQRLEVVYKQLPELEYVVYRGAKPEVNLGDIKLMPFEELRSDDDSPIDDPNAPSDVSVFVYTSGTTGQSKGCVLSHNNMVDLAKRVILSDDRREGDVVWTCLPFFHFNAQSTTVVSSTLLKGTAWIAPRFSLSRFWRDIEQSGAVVASLLGAMIALVGQAPDNEEMIRCRGQLRTVAGAPFPPEMQKIFKQRFGVLRAGSNIYGLTEASTLTFLPPCVESKPGSAGMPNPDFDVRIFDDNGSELPKGQTGEVVCRPLKPNIMFKGYHNRPEATMSMIQDMWFHTGDIGKIDEDGYFYFVDRKKDYLRRRGENISSYEVETLFQNHPEISEVAAHAVPSELGEDDLKITLVLEEGSRVTEEELCRWCIDQMPYFAVPRYIEFRSKLPKNPLGKVEKYKLRDQGRTATTWDIEESTITLQKR